MRKQLIILVIILAGWGLLRAAPAQAHRVSVFAWVEGNTIYTTAKFSGGRAAQESLIEVYDSQKKLLLKGKSDRQGAFSFPIPKIDDLTIVVQAGSGHRGSWKIKKDELKIATDSEPATDQPAAAAPVTAASSDLQHSISSKSPAVVSVSAAELERIVKKVVAKTLDQKLHPLTVMMAESLNPDPGFKDVMGGLGYILGLFGIAAYVQSRKQKSNPDPKQNS